MNKFRARLPQAIAAFLVIGGALGSFGWLSWNATHRADLNFLPRMGEAEWIIYPTPAQGRPHSKIEMATVFRCGFTLPKTPSQAKLQVAGLRYYAISLNGKDPGNPVRASKNWKKPDTYDAAKLLVAGQNEIAVTVSCSNGPPALWLTLDADEAKLISNEAWESSLAGAEWRNAELATEPHAIIPGSQLAGSPRVWDGFKARWPVLLIFALLSAGGYWFAKKVVARLSQTNSAKASLWLELLPLLVLIIVWVTLFSNNVALLPEMFGFDASGHMKYIRYLMEKGALPLADDGFEMFQPPLYYLLCAGLLKLLHLSIAKPAAIVTLRLLGMTIGIGHFIIVWATLRLLFPGERSKAWFGLVLAALLPPVIYLSSFISNEGLAAMLVSGCVCLMLYALKQQTISWKLCAALGVCIGAALFTKFTAIFVVPPICGALIWRWLENRGESIKRGIAKLAFIFVLCALVCGIHYGRTWVRFGTPLIGNWDPRTGYSYWQDDGYRTTASLLRFGRVLSQPFFSSVNSLPDAVYSTLWGDGLLGGTAMLEYRPPWNYDLMGVGYWLALIPTLLVCGGGVLALRTFLRNPTPQWFLLLGLSFLALLALIHGSLLWPATGTAKAFYALPALVPFCALGAWGADAFQRRFPRVAPVLMVSLFMWALNTCASFWISSSSSATLLAEARSLREALKYPYAINALLEGITTKPQDTKIRTLLVDTLLRASLFDQAGKEGQILLAQDPNNATAHHAVMADLSVKNQLPEAEEHGRHGIAAAPGNVEIYEQLARVLYGRGDLPETERISRRGLGMDPFSSELRFTLGMMLARYRRDNEAIPQLQLAAILRPDWSPPHGVLGDIFADQKRLNEAAKQYSFAIKFDANNPSPHIELGKILALQGKLAEATNHFREALRLEPTNKVAALELSSALNKKPNGE